MLGVWNLVIITGYMNCGISPVGCKNNLYS